MCLLMSVCAVLFPARCLGWDLGLNWSVSEGCLPTFILWDLGEREKEDELYIM